MDIECIAGAAVHGQQALIVDLYHRAFPDISAPDYVEQRIPLMRDPVLHFARNEDAQALGFKLAYRRGPSLLFSWLGGVLPEARRRGIAASLMVAQHDWARSVGYGQVETHTRSGNSAMIIANLRAGFEIIGMEAKDSHLMLIQQKQL